MKIFILIIYCVVSCDGYEILAIFPHNGWSHHIFFSALVEELATRQHNVTVIDSYPVAPLPNLRHISLQDEENATNHDVDIERRLKFSPIPDILKAYSQARAFQFQANAYCKKLMNNRQIKELIASAVYFDVVIVEQFVTDCGLAVAYKLNAPTVGITTHVLMPWTYSRIGAPDNPGFVPNRSLGYGTKPNLWNKIKSAIINIGMNTYYTHVTQRIDQKIVNEVYPDTPHLEYLGKNMSLIMINQYYPLTGPRLYGPNVVEIGGLHIKKRVHLEDEDLQKFLDNADKDVVYISFGTVASNFPDKITNEIKKLIEAESGNMLFIWKTNLTDWVTPSNVFIGTWMPQTAILCHPKVVAFITHSGMLSTSEAVYCGVPIVGIPLFGDQFANAQSAVESGIGVTVDMFTLNQRELKDALNIILQEKYQKKAKELSRLWKDRPLSPMDTAIFWIEYVARNKGAVNLKPPTVDMPLYEYLMLDVILAVGSVSLLIVLIIVKAILFVKRKIPTQKIVKKKNE
ncbi:hypothetical protein PYW07_012303 [Mythimna separata]|uniref:UDP-glucuronosyltransferase n=1 Tax=Mythimna separata TaxID=271217 RepID=A0AAD7YLZ2_MYTSE|nr:hypothetical protein PYW07_012303 [Mythimna separata]